MTATSLIPGTFTGKERNRIDWHLARLQKRLPIRVSWVGCGATIGYEIEDLHAYCEREGADTGEVLDEMRGMICAAIHLHR